jgi:hypothetical protein
MLGRGPQPALVAFVLSAVVSACGDVKDVQVPLLPTSRTQRSIPELPVLVVDVRPQAVTSVELRGGGGDAGACPFEYSALLPRSIERSELALGQGERLVDGPDALVNCRVRAPYESPWVFEVDVHVAHDDMPRFVVKGAMSSEGPNVLGLVLVTADRDRIEAECAGEALELVSGAVWFRLSSCEVRRPDGEPLACDLAVTAIFENCSP